ncbi:NAC domain-containing protein 96-like [Diospyros lotus]|uniref:NAC domain-containing protein 96-like n=1 Tax=Diospyros lotus TaxID=55363 RepID=UPI002255BAA2|nr:NAC domain-containing protein 96-like [Diospyros lotus]
MYTPIPARPRNINSCWRDEELCMFLVSVAEGLAAIPENMKEDVNPYQYLPSNLPENVTADVNPYQCLPSNLPDGIWYLMRSERKQNSEHGFWKATGEACEIFTDSSLIGWRTTLEFYKGQAPHGRKTNWVMQEYKITEKSLHINSNSNESNLLCRVFPINGTSPNQEGQNKLGVAEIAGRNDSHPKSSSLVPNTSSTAVPGCMNESQVRRRDENTGPPTAAREIWSEPLGNVPVNEYILGGDFLELDDLADPESQSSCSDNTSCLSLTSDDYFDSQALLKDIGDEEHGRDDNCKFFIAKYAKPNEVVICAPTLGSPIGSERNKKPPAKDTEKQFLDGRVLENAIERQKADKGIEGTSNCHNVAASSSRHKAVPREEKQPPVGKKKKLKNKYLCFLPF